MKMNKKQIGVLCMSGLLAFSSVIIPPNMVSYAAGKTQEAFEANNYDDKSDAKVIYNGIKSYDSKYTGVFKEKSAVSNSNFYSKSRTIKYWASEGNMDGQLWGNASSSTVDIDIFNDKDNFSWSGSNLEFVFLAACNQLNKEGKNPVKKYAKAMLGNKAVRVICGYHSNAPGKSYDYKVAEKFLKYAKTGESVKSSWIKANEDLTSYTNAKNYAVLTHSGNVQYSRFPGFSSKTYSRPGASSKKIIRFRRGVESGETIINTASINKGVIGTKIPNYRLKSKPIKIVAKKNCRDVVFHDETSIITDGGDIRSEKININNKQLYNESINYFRNNLSYKEGKIILKRSNMSVAPILAEDILSDGEEETIAYSIQFQNDYEGIPIEGEGYQVIIDNEGIKYTSNKWNQYEKEEIKTEVLDVEDAVEILEKEIKKERKSYGIMAMNQEKGIKKLSVSFVYNGESGYYEPAYHFEFVDNSIKDVSCVDGTLLEKE